MQNLNNETPTLTGEYLPLVVAIENATGRRVHLSTALRWGSRGSRGVKLSTKVLGGRRFTTIADVLHFMDQLSNRDSGGIALSITPPTIAEREAEAEANKLRARLAR